jgi:hypothetical protein
MCRGDDVKACAAFFRCMLQREHFAGETFGQDDNPGAPECQCDPELVPRQRAPADRQIAAQTMRLAGDGFGE